MTTHDVDIDDVRVANVPADPAPANNLSGLLGALGGSADPIAALLAGIGGGAADNPVLPLISQLLASRRPAEPESDPEEDERHAAAEREAVAAREEMERRLMELDATVASVYAELEALRQRNDTLAAALGACYLCFGGDPVCEVCRGRGLPGSHRPDAAAYREFVLPALRRVQIERAGGASTAAGTQRRPAAPNDSDDHLIPTLKNED